MPRIRGLRAWRRWAVPAAAAILVLLLLLPLELIAHYYQPEWGIAAGVLATITAAAIHAAMGGEQRRARRNRLLLFGTMTLAAFVGCLLIRALLLRADLPDWSWLDAGTALNGVNIALYVVLFSSASAMFTCVSLMRVPDHVVEGPEPVTIVFLAASPRDMDEADLGIELREIRSVLRSTEYRDHFRLQPQWAVRMSDVSDYLLEHKPGIVHFSGHGSAGEIVLEDDKGNSEPVPVEDLSRRFAALKENIRCVVLNACYSQPQAEAIVRAIDCVIGMTHEVDVDDAVAFAKTFYRALGYGRSVRLAFDAARAELPSDSENEAKLLERSEGVANTLVFAGAGSSV